MAKKSASQSFDQRHYMSNQLPEYAIVVYHNGNSFAHYHRAFLETCYFSDTTSQQLALLLTTSKKHVLLNESTEIEELLPVADHLARKYKLESTVVNKDEFISQFC